jgi:UDP-3-O-[3-hydroxymyristoyl] glucosamine N-acyltransferase
VSQQRGGLGTVAEIAAGLGGRVRGDGAVVVTRLAAIDDVDRESLTFATDERYLRAAIASPAAAVLTDARLAESIETSKALILVDSARAALAQLLEKLEPPRLRGPARDPSAVVDPSAHIGEDVVIGPHAVVGPRAAIGAGCVLHAGAFVGADAVVGNDAILHPHAMLLDRCVAGNRVVLQAGAVVGSDGFGYVFVDGRFKKIPQVGNVELGDDVEIGANACIDRAQTGTTYVGEGTKIDNLVQIAHNCRIGKHSAFAALTGMAGSTIVGDYVRVGGAALFKGHVTVGSNVTIGGRTEVWNDIPDGAFVSGRPAKPHRLELRLQVLIQKLPKLFARVDALEGKKSGSSED